MMQSNAYLHLLENSRLARLTSTEEQHFDDLPQESNIRLVSRLSVPVLCKSGPFPTARPDACGAVPISPSALPASLPRARVEQRHGDFACPQTRQSCALAEQRRQETSTRSVEHTLVSLLSVSRCIFLSSSSAFCSSGDFSAPPSPPPPPHIRDIFSLTDQQSRRAATRTAGTTCAKGAHNSFAEVVCARFIFGAPERRAQRLLVLVKTFTQKRMHRLAVERTEFAPKAPNHNSKITCGLEHGGVC